MRVRFEHCRALEHEQGFVRVALSERRLQQWILFEHHVNVPGKLINDADRELVYNDELTAISGRLTQR